MSTGESLLSPPEVAEIGQLRLDGLATSIALGGLALTLWRLDEGTGEPVEYPAVTVARRFANRQAATQGSDAAASAWIAGDFRAFSPWDVVAGDRFVLADGPGRIVPPITDVGGIVTASFQLDQGSP